MTVLRVREMDIQISEDTEVAGLSTGTIVGLMGRNEATIALSALQIEFKHNKTG